MAASSTSAGDTRKLYIRGTISNGASLAFLLLISTYLPGLSTFALTALGMQYLVYLIHGLPYRSEKFYDLSGSFTHLAVVVVALLAGTSSRRSPRQLFTAIASVIWMTRLGTFLYNRILRDGKDGRFDHIKPLWFSFLGAWSIQAVWVTLIQMPVILINLVDDSANTSISPVEGICMALWLGAFLIEAAADSEKMQFRADPANKSKYITTGLWAYSRHPNYFGEISMVSTRVRRRTASRRRLDTEERERVYSYCWRSPSFLPSFRPSVCPSVLHLTPFFF